MKNFSKRFKQCSCPGPGGCTQIPGATVEAGVTGKLEGFVILVSGGTFDRSAKYPSDSKTAGFVGAVFGNKALYDIPTFVSSLPYGTQR